MKHSPTIRAWAIAGLFGLAAAGITQPPSTADAATVDFYNVSDGTALGSTGPRFSVSCYSDSTKTTGVDCAGALIDVSLNNFDTTAPLFGDLTSSLGVGVDPSEELAFVRNYVSDPTLDWTGVADTTDNPGDNGFFFSLAEYVLFTIGEQPRVGLLRNDSGAGMWIDFVANTNGGTGGGLSHYGEFGVIPIPATLPLFLTGLLGFGFLARRRRQMAEA